MESGQRGEWSGQRLTVEARGRGSRHSAAAGQQTVDGPPAAAGSAACLCSAAAGRSALQFPRPRHAAASQPTIQSTDQRTDEHGPGNTARGGRENDRPTDRSTHKDHRPSVRPSVGLPLPRPVPCRAAGPTTRARPGPAPSQHAGQCRLAARPHARSNLPTAACLRLSVCLSSTTADGRPLDRPSLPPHDVSPARRQAIAALPCPQTEKSRPKAEPKLTTTATQKQIRPGSPVRIGGDRGAPSASSSPAPWPPRLRLRPP